MGNISAHERNQLNQFLTVQRWMRDKTTGTQIHYLRDMVRFGQLSKMDPDQFLAFAKKVEPVEVGDLIDKTADGLGPGARFNFRTNLRSFLRHNGFNNLPRAKLTYTLQDWHRGYKKEEVRRVLSYLDSKIHKLYVYLCAETGLRARTVLALRYSHVREDLEQGIVPVAVRLEPKFYAGKKSAGFTFLGSKAAALLKECIKDGLVKTKPDSRLIPLSYSNCYDVVVRAVHKAGIDPKVQTNHGLRKYFEDALDRSGLDHDRKMVVEGHLGGTRPKHYTDRDWDDLRELYKKAYPNIDVDNVANPEIEKRLLSWEDEKQKLEKTISDQARRIQALETQQEMRQFLLERNYRPEDVQKAVEKEIQSERFAKLLEREIAKRQRNLKS